MRYLSIIHLLGAVITLHRREFQNHHPWATLVNHILLFLHVDSVLNHDFVMACIITFACNPRGPELPSRFVSNTDRRRIYNSTLSMH